MAFNWFRQHENAMAPVLKKFNSTPIPDRTTPITTCPLLVLDLETTGLDASKDHIISIGWLPIRQREIILGEANHHLVTCPVSVGQSATIHGVLDSDLKNAQSLRDVLTDLLERYAGYIFVAHHAPIERAFLGSAIQRCFGGKAKLTFIDTLAIEQSRLQRQGLALSQDALQLRSCLQRYGLPESAVEHHALEDAYGCALLLLAQISRSRFSVGEILRQSN